MPRDIPVGNGSFLIAFDRSYTIRDIYYPYVGKENQSDGHRFRFGIWVDGKMSWIDEGWHLQMAYDNDSLVTRVVARNDRLHMVLHCSDLIDYRENIYLRKIVVKNALEKSRVVRLFFHHDFHLLESPTGDTAYYDPDERALIHYKANRYFLMTGMREGKQGMDQYATGVKEFGGLEGTWRDAEDGLLEGSPIAQGSVDSVLSLWTGVAPGGEKTVYYWMAAGRNYAEVSDLNRMVTSRSPEHFLVRTGSFWQVWVNKENFDFARLPVTVVDFFKRSLLIIRTNTDKEGAVLAANDSDIQTFISKDNYSYMWPRDGALVVHSLDLAGYPGLARKFYEFCLDLMSEGKEASGYFLHKYMADGCFGSSWHPWTSDGERRLPIQEDETGLVLWSLWSHFNKGRDMEFIEAVYENLIMRSAEFLLSYRDRDTGLPLPSYDLWEEKWGIHTFTTSAVYAGLVAAENFALFFQQKERADAFGQAAGKMKRAMETHLYRKDLKRFVRTVLPARDGSFEADLTVDASTYAPFYFGIFDPLDEKVAGTMKAIEEHLAVRTDVGGVARYEGDRYHGRSREDRPVPGNPWILCSLWLAQYRIASARNQEELDKALPLLEWVMSRALPSGVLPEQVDPYTGEPVSVSPLTWAHSTFVTCVLEYLQKLEMLTICPTCGMPSYRLARKE
ncbi:MAG: Glycosyl hydrolases family 15 [Syntrophorhabdaceae bacterium PtaU1.Bin034]|nr:MAG: Glycosyl hydrolases family 15 [Syntrophorhabdaceae bacterium PtaU1.Bin034]